MTEKRAAYLRQWRDKNRVRLRLVWRAFARKRYLENPQYVQSINRKSYLNNRDKALRDMKAYRKENRAKLKLCDQKWRETHREQYNATKRLYYHKNLDKHRLIGQQKYERNGESIRRKHREYAKRTKGNGRAEAAWLRRRALKMGATINPLGIKLYVAKIKSLKTVKCYYCSNLIPVSGIHFDHIIPLVKGGSHSAENLCVSCPTCNLKKGAKSLSNWRKSGQQVLAL